MSDVCRISPPPPSNAKDHCHTHATPALLRFQSETLLLWVQRSVSIHSYPRNCISKTTETPPLLRAALLSWMCVRWGKNPFAFFSILKIGFVGSTRPKFSIFFFVYTGKISNRVCPLSANPPHTLNQTTPHVSLPADERCIWFLSSTTATCPSVLRAFPGTP